MQNTPKPVNEVTLSMMGMVNLAYIKPVEHGHNRAYAICAADGTQLAVFPSKDAAYFTARQNNLEPVNIH
jgi:hypothetical protein